MNKQQLASLIWDYCNDLRGSISTVEYKDIILGFIFYRYLSENEEKELISIRWTREEIATDLNDDEGAISHMKDHFGYFIKYEHLFSTWHANSLKNDNSFNVSSVTDALNEFTKNIADNYQKVYAGIFKSLKDKLSKLGTVAEQTKHIKNVLDVVNFIPMDGRQGYDVLGFIYEYLLANFASNAGKKDGEFYTPHEISVLMSEIVAEHLKDREQIHIFDPTSGSGSLLINIGQSLQKYLKEGDSIVYYAQEKIEDTYNLTRMNLVMRGIKPANIFVRCADTLLTDWPYIDDNDNYKYIPVDCVVSNPPYSKKWDPQNHTSDKRYKNYGLAPASKADYAFLLHDLYHLKDDGIMCIVMPHGVLFRGGDEGEIRKQLIEKNNIETIIGLPANIFYGTGIPTIILILKKHRESSDVLFIDASKEFYKDGNKNKLLGCHIRKITDAVLNRKDIPNFAKLVKKEEIKAQEFNLNIPRYVSSDIPELPSDINCTILGNIPNYEIDSLQKFWEEFETLREGIFDRINDHVSAVKSEAILDTVKANENVKDFEKSFIEAFSRFESELKTLLIDNAVENPHALKQTLTGKLFDICAQFEIVDKYEVYRAFDEVWDKVLIDLNTIQEHGFDVCRKTEDVKTYDKKEGKVSEKKNESGVIIPFDLIASELFVEEYKSLADLTDELESVTAEFDSYWEELDEDLKADLKKDDAKQDEEESKLDSKKLKQKKEEVYDSLDSPLLKKYSEYFVLSVSDQILFEKSNPDMVWPEETKRKKGVFKKGDFKTILQNVKDTLELDENEEEYKIRKLFLLTEQISSLKKQKNALKKSLDQKAVEKLALLTDDEVKILLNAKWITPVMENINAIPSAIISTLVSKIKKLVEKYNNPLQTLESDIVKTEKEVKTLLKDLTGNEFDMQGIEQLARFLAFDPSEMLDNIKSNSAERNIRFSEFKSSWVESSLGGLGAPFTGLSGKSKKDFGHGEAKYITYMNVFKNTIASQEMTDDIEIDASQNTVQYGDVLFTTSSETPDEVGMSSVWLGEQENIYLNSFCFGYRLHSNVKIDPYFMAYLMRSPKVRKEFMFLAQGISRYNISKTKAMDIQVDIPVEYEEQVKIGKLFYNLDSLIDLNMKKYKKLEQLKSAMLNKMFVQ